MGGGGKGLILERKKKEVLLVQVHQMLVVGVGMGDRRGGGEVGLGPMSIARERDGIIRRAWQ